MEVKRPRLDSQDITIILAALYTYVGVAKQAKRKREALYLIERFAEAKGYTPPKRAIDPIAEK